MIDKFSWYQTIDFGDGKKSKGIPYCGDPAWENMKQFLPETLEGKRVLDLGCNAGIFCIRSILLGAKECVGVDSDDWKKDVYLPQAKFVKEYFEKQHNKSFNIEFVKERMEDYLAKDVGVFDYCYAIASLYYAKDADYVVKRISETCRYAIIRLRDESKIQQFTSLFSKYGFILEKEMRENWAEKLKAPANDFYLYGYRNAKVLL